MGTPRWFITHTHMDHILALPAYAARRQMMDMSTPTVFLPAQRVGEAQALLTAFTRLDNGRLPCRFVGVMPGDEIELSRELVVTVLKTYHSVPSVGYIVWERRKKLKEEYTVALVSHTWSVSRGKRSASRTVDFRNKGLGYKLNYCPECGKEL